MIRKLFDLIVYISHYRISLFLLNLRSKYHTKKNIFYYSKKNLKYYVFNKSKKFYILEKKRLNFYIRGFDNRIKNLSDEYLLNLIEIKNNDVIIDCGANIGEFRYCFPNKINYFGFEPGTGEFSCLKLNVNDENIYDFGLWNENTNLEFYINSENADSSFIQPSKYFKKSNKIVKKLDSIIRLQDKKIKLLKLEAEGCEPEVLEGSIKILKNIEYISADLGYERGIQKESTFETVNTILINNHFTLIQKNKRRLVCLYKNNKYDKFN